MDKKSSFERYTADYIEIRQLIEKYTDVVNRRHWEEIPALFHPTARWEALAPVSMHWKGLDQIKEKLPASVERMDVLIQTTSGIVIDVRDSEHATARSLLTEFGRNKQTKEGMHSVAFYEDELLKENGNWYFTKRTLSLIYNDQLPVPGNVKDYKY